MTLPTGPGGNPEPVLFCTFLLTNVDFGRLYPPWNPHKVSPVTVRVGTIAHTCVSARHVGCRAPDVVSVLSQGGEYAGMPWGNLADNQ